MTKTFLTLLSCLALLFTIGACFQTLAPVQVAIDPAGPAVSYVEDVAPILDRGIGNMVLQAFVWVDFRASG